MRRRAKLWVPFAALAFFGGISLLVVAIGQPVVGKPVERVPPNVQVLTVELRRVPLQVVSQGTVEPQAQSALVPEVDGRVVWVSPALVTGGHFDAGQALLRLDRSDHAASLRRARAALDRLAGEAEHATRMLARQRGLADRNFASEAALEEAERRARVAQARLDEARVAVEQAERDLERTELRAPFRGRVRSESVDRGQFVRRGDSLAHVYATDRVEVRLPVADSELAYLDAPLYAGGPVPESLQPEVSLRASFAGRERSWHGRIVRTEAEIDTSSRLVHMVARVDNDSGSEEIPLPVGLFVAAAIEGRTVEGVAAIPREALSGDDRVLVVDSDDRLRFRSVNVLRTERDLALVESGLADGERICASVPRGAVEGMSVTPFEIPARAA